MLINRRLKGRVGAKTVRSGSYGEEHEGSLGDAGNVFFLDLGAGNMGVFSLQTFIVLFTCYGYIFLDICFNKK